MAAPGSAWEKLPKLGKAAAHAFGHGKFADAYDALTGFSDRDVEAFAKAAQQALAERGTEWSRLGATTRDLAADRLSEILSQLDPATAWGAALEGPVALRDCILESGGRQVLVDFAPRDINRDPESTEPGRVLTTGQETEEGQAFSFLLSACADLMHARALSVTSLDDALLIGALRSLLVEAAADRQDRADANAKLDHLIALVEKQAIGPQQSPNPKLGSIRVGWDKKPRPAVAFVERPELSTLRSALSEHSTATLCQLQGMRGVGKSQLAAAYIDECDADGFEVVAWIDARTRTDAVTNLSGLVAAYTPAESDEEPEHGIRRLLNRFASADHGERRLLVFDNVEDFSDLDGCLPRDARTQVVITTVRRTHALGTSVPVDTLAEEAAIAYLEERTGLGDREGAQAVCRAVGGLALAVAQAAAAITGRPEGYDRFLTALAARPIRDNLLREEGGDYPLGAAQAIALALDTVVARASTGELTGDQPRRSGMIAVLDALALLAEGGVPREWLYALGDEFQVDDVIRDLVTASLANVSADGSTVSLHGLTRRVYAEERLGDAAATERACGHASQTLGHGLPSVEATYGERRAALAGWLDHLASLLSSGSTWVERAAVLTLTQGGVFLGNEHHLPYGVIACDLLPEISARVLGPDHPGTIASRNNLAGAYESAGDLGRAIPLYEQNLIDRERVLGPDHPDTLTSRNNLAGAYESAGDLGRAIPLYEQTLTDSERVLGPDHPGTLTSRNNLAGAYRSAGDLGRAIPLYEQTLTDRERVLGPDHPDTLTSRNNLAGAYRSAGDLGRAIPLYEQTLTDRERVLGPDHPDTLTSRNNLAGAYESAGDLGRAIPLYEQNLTDSERVLGPDHPGTLTSRNNLAGAYRSAGDLGRAIPLYEQNLTDRERVLGPDHPGTLTSRNNLAGAYESAGDLGRAIPLYEQNLTDSERVLGPDHPGTLTSRNNLAGAYRSAGDLGRAIPLYEQTLTDRERVLGPDHPGTLASRNNLAYAYESAGDLGRAIPLYEQNLTDRERVLGPDHPGTLTSRNNLAGAYESAGDLGRAIPLYEQTLTDRERVLGPDHPDTLTSRNNLAGAYESAGDLGRAIPLYEQNLIDRERVLGPDHPGTLASRNNLAYAYESAGDLGRAIPLYEQTLTDRERVLGPDHPDTLTSRNNLAYAYESAGDLGRAIPLYEQNLIDRERVLGPDHPDTLTSRNNLAGAYESAGDLGRAIPLYEQNLIDRERVLGPDHPDTLTSRNNLAYAYESAGDLGRAIPLYEQNLTDSERVLGPDHPGTLTSRNNLAGAYRSAGDLGRAIPLYEQTLTDRERVLGPDHPGTLASRNNLSSALWHNGDRRSAFEIMEEAERVARDRLSHGHPLIERLAQNVTEMRRQLAAD